MKNKVTRSYTIDEKTYKDFQIYAIISYYSQPR